jgi:hypothetical protein
MQRSEMQGRMMGQAFLLTFAATGKSETPSRAEPMLRKITLIDFSNLARDCQSPHQAQLLGRNHLHGLSQRISGYGQLPIHR